ncbi:PREDICTED: uncharacterized protein LOC104806249 [Tarenaya hassleriana]|uniref:uncharacterized protein LOC104806249 n=1 Tax=Tarenaya hassleriana TaxID=28532 RepID=UPI00053C4B71|nr:PREDICTED: uncharacterized protein LOC104806249 [Tarenaya hassleriana]
MPLPWKKAKSGRISRLVSDLQQSSKHGGSLVVETGFPTSLIDLFVKNRDRLKKHSSKRRQSSTVNPPPSPPPPLTRRSSFPPPAPLPPPVERETVASSEIEERISTENTPIGDGACVVMVVVKVFVVAVIALSTKKLTVGITLSAFALLLLEFAAARVFTRLEFCPNARTRLRSFLERFPGKGETVKTDGENSSSCEITETFEDSRDCTECTNTVSWSEPELVVIPEADSSAEDSRRAKVTAEGEVQTIRDLVFKDERSKSSRLKSKIMKKIVPKKFSSMKKKKKSMKIDEEKEKEEESVEEEEEEGSLTEVSSLVSDDKSERVGSEISEMDDDDPNPPLLENCTEVEEESQDGSSKGNSGKTNVFVLFVMMLVGLLGGKLLAIALFLFWCLILRFSDKSKAPEKLFRKFFILCPESFLRRRGLAVAGG